MSKILLLFFVVYGWQLAAYSQENSPYSRYGLGDIIPSRNVFSRGMGGIAAGVTDYQGIQSINFTNPAALASINNTIFDGAVEGDWRLLKNTDPAKKFTSVNSLFSYLQMGFPLTTSKMYKKDIRWAASFGLRPVTRINYKIEKQEYVTGIDNLKTLYEGNGGVNQAFIGTALKIKGFSVGFNAGYMFGNKEYSTKLRFINDEVPYYMSNSSTKISFGGVFIDGGIQYEKFFNKDKKNEMPKILRIGAYGGLQRKLNASRDDIRETVAYDNEGNTYTIDNIDKKENIKGAITYPATMGFGASYQNAHWLYGLDFEAANWNNYRFYDQPDAVQNSWMIRAGAQYYPAKINSPAKKYFNFVKYRAGLYYGSDYIKTTSSRPEYGITIGTGMPLTSLKRISYNGEYAVLNTALEIGSKGNKNTNIRENIIRFSIGISMNARWFQKPKYD